MANYHLAILAKRYLQAILSGQKTVESRFTRTRRAPFGRISPEDKIFLKLVSGPVCATAAVSKVKFFENLTHGQIIKIKKQYNNYICGSDNYWQSIRNCRFGCLIWLKDVQEINPMRINKRDWRAWAVLTEKEDFGLLKIGV